MKTTPHTPGTVSPAPQPRSELGAWLLGSALAASACQASVQADAKLSSTDESEPAADFAFPREAASVKAEPVSDKLGIEEYALLGARHDLNYNGPKTPTCQCLAAVLSDQAADPAFEWDMAPPHLEPSSEWVIALSSNGVACDATPSGTLGASYQGYTIDGNDVVVSVEALGEGRPMTNGAIIPKPTGTGSVLIEPAGAVYGKPLDGGKGKRCKVAPATSAAPTSKK